ncbi:MAG: amino acid ABC transporter permease [Pseudomonadota bacterium]
MNYNWNWKIFWEASPEGTGTYLASLVSGLGWTLATGLCAWAMALALGILVGVMRTLPSRPAVRAGNAYVEVFRNIPLLVQMFLWFFVVPELLPAALGQAVKQMPHAPFFTAVVCLGFFASARVAEQLKAGILALPRGQSMAGMAMGLTTAQTYRHVVLPQALRIVLPPLTSEFLNLIKNSAVALTIGLLELTSRARAIQEFSFQVFEALTAATLVYLTVNIAVIAVARAIERRVAVPGLISGPQSAGH